MPLKDQLPIIDDRNYDQIVAEIRARIPHYSPEWKPVWNDLNDSDPGVILAQVFAHLTEMMLFRMNRVPDLAYLKFLEIIGIELMPARSARAEITFAVDESWSKPTVDVPPRVQVAAEADEGPPVVFETERSLTAIACKIISVQQYDGAYYKDVTAENRTLIAFAPFGELPRVDGALVLGFGFSEAYPEPDRFPQLSIDLALWTVAQPDKPLLRQCGPGATIAYAPARLRWEAWDGIAWQRIEGLNDETLAFTRSGHLIVRVGSRVAQQIRRDHMGAYEPTDAAGNPQPGLFWLRARLLQAQYDATPHLLAIRTNTVPAVQAQTVSGEVLGGTTGGLRQKFQLENAPVLKDGIGITIDEGLGPEEWGVKDDLLGSGPIDKHLMVNWTSGEVVTGDGENGSIPVANASNPDANVIANYRFGGGKRGNVGAGKISNLLTPVAGIEAGKTTNVFDAGGGADEETLDNARKRARRELRARDRAVTPEDFELLAKQAANVRRAKALPLVHPQFPGISVPGAVTLIVVPDADLLKIRMPLPSDALLRTVCAYLDARRLLTTELFVLAPCYVKVEVRAEVVCRGDADPGHVRDDIDRSLLGYLHPLIGGDDGEGWPFGGPVRYSKVTQRVFSVDGVDSVRRLVLLVDGQEQPECRDVEIQANALVYSLPHDLTVGSMREFEELP